MRLAECSGVESRKRAGCSNAEHLTALCRKADDAEAGGLTHG
jgi:hypothetical protein